MFSIKVPQVKKIAKKKNAIGLTLEDYGGGDSTLCGGCGHDSITKAIILSCFELNIYPHKVAKYSGIGCSSKTPAYFLKTAHGFNAVHGRMPAIVTGASCAANDMLHLAVSGDGDTGSIGLSHFIHAMRRQLNMTYIVENNGVYGLTKGQFSATSDLNARGNKGAVNAYQSIDLAQLALQMGASFVARSFSADKKQLVPLLKEALMHPGFALIDVLSPCVSFNNHSGSTKSYQFIRENMVQAEDYDPESWQAAQDFVLQCNRDDKIATGLLYRTKCIKTMHEMMNTDSRPLREIPHEDLSPGLKGLDAINESYKIDNQP